MGGGMEANKNRFIEEWGSARENLEHNFRWTRRNLALVGLFGIAFPIFVYKGIVKEFILPCTCLSLGSEHYPCPCHKYSCHYSHYSTRKNPKCFIPTYAR